MDVAFYIKTRFHGNPIGNGTAVSILEYKGKTDHTHTRVAIVENKGTKNELFLKICIESLKRLKKPCSVTIYIDSPYIKGVLTRKLLEKWQTNEWRKTTKKKPANLADWKQMYNLLGYHQVRVQDYNNTYEKELMSLLEKGG